VRGRAIWRSPFTDTRHITVADRSASEHTVTPSYLGTHGQSLTHINRASHRRIARIVRAAPCCLRPPFFRTMTSWKWPRQRIKERNGTGGPDNAGCRGKKAMDPTMPQRGLTSQQFRPRQQSWRTQLTHASNPSELNPVCGVFLRRSVRCIHGVTRGSCKLLSHLRTADDVCTTKQ